MLILTTAEHRKILVYFLHCIFSVPCKGHRLPSCSGPEAPGIITLATLAVLGPPQSFSAVPQRSVGLQVVP